MPVIAAVVVVEVILVEEVLELVAMVAQAQLGIPEQMAVLVL
jgi:hypothetical protein